MKVSKAGKICHDYHQIHSKLPFGVGPSSTLWGRAKLTYCIFKVSIPSIGVYGVYFALLGPKMIDIGTLRFSKLK